MISKKELNSLPSGVAQQIEKDERARRISIDIQRLVAEYRANGRQATMALFDKIAKQRKLKNFEAHMLIIGFQRECAEQGLTLK